jgi:hypothetical protein
LTKFCLGFKKYDAYAADASHANGQEGSGFIVSSDDLKNKP